MNTTIKTSSEKQFNQIRRFFTNKDGGLSVYSHVSALGNTSIFQRWNKNSTFFLIFAPY